MSKATVLRTKDDGRYWLISSDKPAVSEISASAAKGLGALVTEVEKLAAATERSTAAASSMPVVIARRAGTVQSESHSVYKPADHVILNKYPNEC